MKHDVSLPAASAAIVLIVAVAAAASICQGVQVADSLELFMMGRRVGMLIEQLRPRKDGLVEERSLLSARIPDEVGGDSAQELIVREERLYGPDGMLQEAMQSIESGAGVSTWRLQRRGDHWYQLRVIGGQHSQQRLEGPPGDRIDNTCELLNALRAGTIRPGQQFEDPRVELITGQSIVSRMRCVQAPAFHNRYEWKFVIDDGISGKEERWVVDTAGRTLLRSLQPFFEARARGYLAYATPRQDSTRGLTEMFSVAVPRPPKPASTLIVTLADTLSLDSTGAQFYTRRRDGSYRLRPPLASCPAAVTAGQLARRSPADTAPTPVLQSAHPEITALSDSLSRQSGSVCDAIAVTSTHVYERIRKRSTATFSNALETLRAGFGDCGEHAVLAAALLRAQGIPASVIFGLIYLPERGAFLGHAWLGVSFAEGWAFADPTFGLFPAASGLLPLLIDNEGQGALEVLRLLGNVRVAVE